MINQWLSWLNCALFGLVVCFLLAAGFYWITRPGEIVCDGPISKQCRLPKGSFVRPEEAYQNLGGSMLALESAPPSLQVPDLRQVLIYCGKNGRPDALSTKPVLHFAFVGTKNIASISPGEKLYLVYEKKNSPSRYSFSQNNEPTSIWFEANPVDNDVQVKVWMKNEQGEVIGEPESHAQFKLQEKEFIRFAGNSWEIGNFRVDGTLLARQKARWHGFDKFLERHGGDEFKHTIGKHRIDLGENDDIYSIFVGVGDCFAWDKEKNQWISVEPNEESLKSPLLVIKKIDERIMTFELWDVEGKGKIVLNLLKSTEPSLVQSPQALQHMFKFVGARTRTQCVFEINRERVLLRPSDWLLLTNKGWKKLSTEEDIDQYVKRKSAGALFVFEGVKRKDEKQILIGTLYSPTRCEFQELELPLQNAGAKKDAKDNKDGKDKENKDKENKDGKENKDATGTAKPAAAVPTPPVPPVAPSASNQK